MSHTLTPWKTYYDDSDESNCGWYILRANGGAMPIARCSGIREAETGPRAEANAVHIVHCVNSHEALVEALRELVICPAFNGQLFEKDKESHRAWTLARHALALAEKGAS